MDIVYARGEISAGEVMASLPGSPSDSTVRTLLRILEEKGHLTHREDGPRYLYSPTQSRRKASRSALKRVVETFFDNSLADAVAALVDSGKDKLSDEDLDRIEKLVREAKKRR